MGNGSARQRVKPLIPNQSPKGPSQADPPKVDALGWAAMQAYAEARKVRGEPSPQEISFLAVPEAEETIQEERERLLRLSALSLLRIEQINKEIKEG